MPRYIARDTENTYQITNGKRTMAIVGKNIRRVGNDPIPMHTSPILCFPMLEDNNDVGRMSLSKQYRLQLVRKQNVSDRATLLRISSFRTNTGIIRLLSQITNMFKPVPSNTKTEKTKPISVKNCNPFSLTTKKESK